MNNYKEAALLGAFIGLVVGVTIVVALNFL